MRKFTYVVEPFGIEVSMVAQSEREAYKMVWNSLTPEQQDNCACIDWVDEEEVE